MALEPLDAYVEGTWSPIHAATLEPKTVKRYVQLFDGHVSPGLGSYPLRDLTPEIIGRWQADRLAAGAPVESTRKALTLLGGILQRALEAGRIQSNPQRLVRKAAPAPTEEVRPLAPATVEAIRAALRAGAGRDDPNTRRDLLRLRERDAVMVSLLAYAGLRPAGTSRSPLGARAGTDVDRPCPEDAPAQSAAAHSEAARPARRRPPRMAARQPADPALTPR